MKKIIFTLFCLFMGIIMPVQAQLLFDVKIDSTGQPGKRFLNVFLQNVSKDIIYQQVMELPILEMGKSYGALRCTPKDNIIEVYWGYLKPGEICNFRVEVPDSVSKTFGVSCKQTYDKLNIPKKVKVKKLSYKKLMHYKIKGRVTLYFSKHLY